MMMKRLAALLLAAVMMCACVVGVAEAGVELTVQGTATVTAKPDMMTVTANASVTADSVADAQAEMNRIIADVTAAVLKLGILEDDLITENFSYYPNYNYESGAPQLMNYQANHTLAITCRDVAMLDSVLSAVTDCGMSELYSVTYDVSNRTELYNQALRLAIEETQGKASSMAAAAGLTVTGYKSITENSGYDYGVTAKAGGNLMASTRAESYDSGIRAQAIAVKANVTAVYQAQ